jgi:hypothetical protein
MKIRLAALTADKEEVLSSGSHVRAVLKLISCESEAKIIAIIYSNERPQPFYSRNTTNCVKMENGADQPFFVSN